MQTTLKRDIAIVGTGLHSGRPVRLSIRAAATGFGIWFKRVDVTDRDNMIPAAWDAVSDTVLNTQLGNASGVCVSTVEHLMAALAGCGVSNALIEVDGQEIPILDGSAAGFVQRIQRYGVRSQGVSRRVIRICKRVEVRDGDCMAALEPSDRFEIDYEIDFPEPVIGRQHKVLTLVNGTFASELADSRTFCRRDEVDFLQSRGLALGGTLDNAIVVDDNEVLNPGGFRHADECVRHKMLDAVGDLALAGAPIVGRYVGIRAGHAMTNRLLRKLFLTDGAIRFVEEEGTQAVLPGIMRHNADLNVAI